MNEFANFENFVLNAVPGLSDTGLQEVAAVFKKALLTGKVTKHKVPAASVIGVSGLQRAISKLIDNSDVEDILQIYSDVDPDYVWLKVVPFGNFSKWFRAEFWQESIEKSEAEHTGLSVNYYQCAIDSPTTPGRDPYIAECNDIIEALDMSYAEANMFKEIWRTAAARTLGKKKQGHDAIYGAEKIKFFADRNLHLKKSGKR